MTVKIITGDCRQMLATLPAKSVNCCVTSPPYFGLRDYGVEGQTGLEATPEAFVAEMVAVFREVWRVLKDDGTLWLNLGDSYSHGGAGARDAQRWPKQSRNDHPVHVKKNTGLKPKDMLFIPARVAIALQADGWYCRQDIIWHKPNTMPESVDDRCTKAHEYIFMLTKSARYYFDAEAILEDVSPNTHARLSQNVQNQIGSTRANGGAKTNGNMKAVGRKFDPSKGNKNNPSFDAAMAVMPAKRNKRSVWTVAAKGFKGAHFATFPPKLIEPCILAGCPEGGTVLDPFSGAGTTGLVAEQHKRNSILIELNPAYVDIALRRIHGDVI